MALVFSIAQAGADCLQTSNQPEVVTISQPASITDAFLPLVRVSLWVTAPANLIVGYAFAFPTGALGRLLALPEAPVFYALFSGAIVALFGFVYLWLATQATLNRAILCVGGLGKLIAVVVSGALFFAGELSGTTALLISGDLVFVALWGTYLAREPG